MKNYPACKELWSFFNKKKIRKISHHISVENQKLIPQYSILSGAHITQENSVDPDEMQHNAASHLGLHCNAASQLIWVWRGRYTHCFNFAPCTTVHLVYLNTSVLVNAIRLGGVQYAQTIIR